MADNTILSAGTADGDTIATDDIAGVKYQRVKVNFGVDGAAADVTASAGLPVAQQGTWVLGSNSGVDVGDVTINNGTGASSVPVQGAAAADAASAGNPLLAGARASAAAPTDVSADGDAVALWATLKGALNVADGGGSLTVDGTVAVSGTVTVDGSGVTQPVSHATLGNAHSADFDTGAGTDTTPAFGIAVPASGGAAVVPGDATNGLTVQIASPTAFPVTDNAGSLTVDNAALSVVGGGAEATALRVTVASDSTGVLSVDDNGGALTVDNGGTFAVQATLAAGATTIAKAEDAASADADVGVPAMAVRKATPANTSGTDGDYEMLQMSAGRLWVDPSGVTLTVASHAVTNAGTFAVQESGTHIQADDAAFTVATSKVAMAGFLVDEASTDTADEGDGAAARVTTNRQLIVTVRPNANGEGLDIFRSLDLDETEEDVKTSAGKLYGWFMFNAAASTRYVKFYNATAANTTVGTTTPILTVPLPAGAAANVEFANGIPFGTALCAAATTGVADADTGAPSENDVIVNILFK